MDRHTIELRKPIGRFGAPLFALVGAFIGIIAGTVLPSYADRHCSPVVELYFQSRAEVIGNELDCGGELKSALSLIEDARDSAMDCGCQSLGQALEDFLTRVPREPPNCGIAGQELLALSEIINRKYQNCL